VQELRSQLEAEKTSWDELREELENSETVRGELRSQLEQERADRGEQIRQLLSELADLKQKSATARELPEAADLLNQLKARRKKSKTDLADLEAILEILES
jgi:nucleosome binding factor SPN SPT16 subunit